MYIDLGLLVVFCILISIFLYKKRHNIKREGFFFLYKSKFGLKFMDNFSKKFHKQLNTIAYISITFGYFAMVAMVALLIYNIFVLIKMPVITNAPPIMPVIPYAPQIFKIQGLPNFYFIDWIIILAIMAITHEFAHGIFSRQAKVKVKSSGFGFLGPLPLAFVEPDEKALSKKKKKDQLAMLSAGSFSNFVFFIIFGLIFVLFLSLSFHATTPLYGGALINTSQIESIQIGQTNYTLSEINSTILSNKLIPDKNIVYTSNGSYILTKSLITQQSSSLLKPVNQTIVAYYNAPFINANIQGEILEINDLKYSDPKIFSMLNSTVPGQQIEIKTTKDTYTLTASQNPTNSSKGFIGMNYRSPPKTFAEKLQSWAMSMNNPFMSYEPFNSDIFSFISIFMFWLIMLLFAISTFNMLPFGFLDGGKFFYLTMLGITKSKKHSEFWYKIASLIVVLIIVAMVFVWLWRMYLFKIFI
jgi:membrane-associated protease RseP (regulator of RpoE activity)